MRPGVVGQFAIDRSAGASGVGPPPGPTEASRDDRGCLAANVEHALLTEIARVDGLRKRPVQACGADGGGAARGAYGAVARDRPCWMNGGVARLTEIGPAGDPSPAALAATLRDAQARNALVSLGSPRREASRGPFCRWRNGG